jgi:hypothetical protein
MKIRDLHSMETCRVITWSQLESLLLHNNAYLQLPEKFMGCVIASYLSILSATSTYVEE